MMTGIEFLKKAAIADSLGKFKLADRYFNRAVRLAQAGTFTEAAIEALEKAGVEAGERALVESGEKSIAEVLEAQAFKAIDEAIAGRTGNLREMLKLTKRTNEEIAAKMREFGGLTTAEARKDAMKELAADIQAKNESLFKLEPGPGPGPAPKPGDAPLEIPPGPKDPRALLSLGPKALSYVKKLGPLWSALANNPRKWVSFVTWFATIGGTWEIVGGVLKLFVKGVPILPQDLWKMWTTAKPDMSTGEEAGKRPGEGGAAGGGSGEGAGESGTPGKPNYEYTTPDEMYNLRMKAKLPSGVSQQELQGAKAQEYVNKNKDKFKSKREFYDAALGAGDKNFANSVIAIVHKDMPELPREPSTAV